MSRESFIGEVKRIVGLQRAGDLEGANSAFATLFASADMQEQRPEDRRQALKLLVLAKRSGAPPPALLAALRAAIPPLEDQVAVTMDPEDYEMLGVCRAMTDDPGAATEAIREGLRLERERNPQSDLCGRLMTRLSAL